METTATVTKTEKRNGAIPPYFVLKDGIRYLIEEETKPFINRDECKIKMNELKSENEFETFRIHKHCGRYFIYRKTKR